MSSEANVLVGSLLFGAGSLVAGGAVAANIVGNAPSDHERAADHLEAAMEALYPIDEQTIHIGERIITIRIPAEPEPELTRNELLDAQNILETNNDSKRCLEREIEREIASRQAAKRCILSTLRILDEQNDAKSSPLVFNIGTGLALTGAIIMSAGKDQIR